MIYAKNSAFKNRKALRFSEMSISVVPFNGRRKKFSKKLFCVWKALLCIFRVKYNERLVETKLKR